MSSLASCANEAADSRGAGSVSLGGHCKCLLKVNAPEVGCCHALCATQLWALPEVRALTAKELEASTLEEPEEDAEEAQADAAAADKAEEVRVGSNPEVTLCSQPADQALVQSSRSVDGHC